VGGVAHAAAFYDGTFAEEDWTHEVLTFGSGGSANAHQGILSGNPSEYRTTTNFVNTAWAGFSIVHGYHFSPLFTYNPQANGAIESINYSYDFRTLANQTVGMGLALKQDQQIWYGGYSLIRSSSWNTRSFQNLTSANFSRVSHSNSLDFSNTASSLQFGFLTASSTGSTGKVSTIHIDNFSVEITSLPNIQEFEQIETETESVPESASILGVIATITLAITIKRKQS
jgi:hypothetical protein